MKIWAGALAPELLFCAQGRRKPKKSEERANCFGSVTLRIRSRSPLFELVRDLGGKHMWCSPMSTLVQQTLLRLSEKVGWLEWTNEANKQQADGNHSLHPGGRTMAGLHHIIREQPRTIQKVEVYTPN